MIKMIDIMYYHSFETVIMIVVVINRVLYVYSLNSKNVSFVNFHYIVNLSIDY